MPIPDPHQPTRQPVRSTATTGVQGPVISKAARIVTELDQIVSQNIPYVYGGTSPKTGFDCSGLVQYVFGRQGINLPRTSEGQFTVGTSVSQNDLQPGDLVFSQWPGDDASPGHVAIYVGTKNSVPQIIEAPHTGEDVHQIPLDSSYLTPVVGYRRVTGVTLASSGGQGGTTSSSSSSSSGGLFSFPSDITGFFKDATDSITKTATFFHAFFQPTTYVRIGAGALGGIALIGGLVFLILSAGDS